MNIPDGLHDSSFIRMMFFKNREKLEKSAQERHPTADTYLTRAQRGQVSSAPGVLENKLNYSQSKPSFTNGKSNSKSEEGYKGIDLSSLLDYSKKGNTTYKINYFQGMNYGTKNSPYN